MTVVDCEHILSTNECKGMTEQATLHNLLQVHGVSLTPLVKWQGLDEDEVLSMRLCVIRPGGSQTLHGAGLLLLTPDCMLSRGH